jgi:hypothetical protein
MTCSTMVESVRVERRCWMGLLEGPKSTTFTALIHVTVTWTMPDGQPMVDTKVFNGLDLLALPNGSVPMVSHIYTLPYDGHPGACTPAIVYLVRVHDDAQDLQDVVARIQLRPQESRHDPDAIFECEPLELTGPNIFPLDILDVAE